MLDRKIPFIMNAIKVIRGYSFCKWLSLRYGLGISIFLVCGKKEDVYLYCGLLVGYLKESGISDYVVVSDNDAFDAIKSFYPAITGKCIKVSERLGSAIQRAGIFMGKEKLKLDSPKSKDSVLAHQACAVRSAFHFTLREYYNFVVFSLENEDREREKAVFPKLDDKVQQELRSKKFIDKGTVILSPYSDMVKETYSIFWEILKKDLEKKGYVVYIIDTRESERFSIEKEKIVFPWEMSMSLIEKAGHYIGVKGSLSSMVSEIECNKVIFYPPEKNRFDGNVESMDIASYGMDCFGHVYDGLELTIPFLRSYGNNDPENEDFNSRLKEEKELIDKIMVRFKDLDIQRVNRNASGG